MKAVSLAIARDGASGGVVRTVIVSALFIFVSIALLFPMKNLWNKWLQYNYKSLSAIVCNIEHLHLMPNDFVQGQEIILIYSVLFLQVLIIFLLILCRLTNLALRGTATRAIHCRFGTKSSSRTTRCSIYFLQAVLSQ